MKFPPIIYWIAKGTCWWYVKLFHKTTITGKNNIPQGPVILASNHVSYLDPPLVSSMIHQNAYYLARKTLFDLPILNWVLPQSQVIPIDNQRPDMTGLKKLIQFIKKGNKVLLFPEGERSWDGKLLPAQSGIGFLVFKTNVPVIPIRVFGCHEAWPRGGKLKCFTPLHVTIGTPVIFDDLPAKPTKEQYQKIGQDIMSAIAELRPPKDFPIQPD